VLMVIQILRRNRYLFCVHWLAVSAISAALADGRSATLPSVLGQVPSEQTACGPNCLLIFLQATGIDVTASAIRRCISRDAHELSLSEIQSASVRLGCPVEVRRYDPREGLTLPTPAIVHFDNGADSAGHYVVLVALHDGRATFVDGTTGTAETISAREFAKFWSGYAVVPAMSANSRFVVEFGYLC